MLLKNKYPTQITLIEHSSTMDKTQSQNNTCPTSTLFWFTNSESFDIRSATKFGAKFRKFQKQKPKILSKIVKHFQYPHYICACIRISIKNETGHSSIGNAACLK